MRRINPDAPLTSSQKNKRHYEKHREAELERNRAYHQDNKDVIRLRHRRNRHHLTQDGYDQMVAKQNNSCGICGKEFIETPHIDHRHECCSGNRSCDKCRRGLLCKDCNLGLGRFKDSIEILINAIQYLKEYKNGH